jgi:hypothetical protein
VNKEIITAGGKDFTVRWRGIIDRPTFPGMKTVGYSYTGTINEFRLPHLHKSTDDLKFCAWEIAKKSLEDPRWMENNLGKPEDIEAFLKC